MIVFVCILSVILVKLGVITRHYISLITNDDLKYANTIQWHKRCPYNNRARVIQHLNYVIYRTGNDQWITMVLYLSSRPHFYQTRSAWSVDQGSIENHSPAYNFAPTVTKFCVMWEGLSLPHDTKFGNCRCNIVDSRAFPSWSLIHGLRWSGLIKAEPGYIMSGYAFHQI